MIDSTKSRPASPRSRSLPVSGRRHAPRTLYVKDKNKKPWPGLDKSGYIIRGASFGLRRLLERAGHEGRASCRPLADGDVPAHVAALFLAGLEWEWGMACGLACMLAAGLCTCRVRGRPQGHGRAPPPRLAHGKGIVMERIEIRIIRHDGMATVVMLPAVPANETRRRGMSDHPAGKGRKQ